MSEARTRLDNKHAHLVELQKECVRRGERIQTLTRRMNSARLKVEEAQKELDGSAESERRQWQNRCASALPALTSTESGISGMALLTAHTRGRGTKRERNDSDSVVTVDKNATTEPAVSDI